MTAAFSNVPTFWEVAHIFVPLIVVGLVLYSIAFYVLFTMK